MNVLYSRFLNSLDSSMIFLSLEGEIKLVLSKKKQRNDNSVDTFQYLQAMLQVFKFKFRYVLCYKYIHIDIILIKTISCDTWLDIETRTCSCARIRRAWVILRYQLWVVLRSRIRFKMATLGQHPPALENMVPHRKRAYSHRMVAPPPPSRSF